MLTYVVRRILYSIPVLLIASFLLFVFVRVDVRPAAVRASGMRATRTRTRNP